MDQLYIALAVLLANALGVVAVAVRRCRNELRKHKVEVALEADDALAMPITGSVVLFSFYVLLRFIPKQTINVLISFYLSLISIFSLSAFIKPYFKPNILTGLFCCAVGMYYYQTKNWVANDILAFAMGVTALESVPLNTFSTSFLLLIALFFYDIFWVFGSDVMLTVATGVDGPIKFLFPQTIFSDHTQKSLLGLGDVIIPGFFICQTFIFSRDVVKRGNLYFYTAVIAYFLSLVNTMAVMLIFKHGQPALLFIVPWLLISFLAVVLWNGDVKAACDFDTMKVFPQKGSAKKKKAHTSEDNDDGESSSGLTDAICTAVLQLFGFRCEEEGHKRGKPGKRKDRKAQPEKMKQG